MLALQSLHATFANTGKESNSSSPCRDLPRLPPSRAVNSGSHKGSPLLQLPPAQTAAVKYRVRNAHGCLLRGPSEPGRKINARLGSHSSAREKGYIANRLGEEEGKASCQRLVASGLVYLNLPIAYSPGLQGKLGNVVSCSTIRISERASQGWGRWQHPQLARLRCWAVPPRCAGHCSGASSQGALPGYLLDLTVLQHLTLC